MMARMPSKSFKDLIVWQKAHAWVLEIYRWTEHFPKHELYGLTSQVRRAAVSVPANIAEGFKRTGRKEKIRFLNIAQASLEECRYYALLAKDLGYENNAQPIEQKTEEISKMLEAYSRCIEKSRHV